MGDRKKITFLLTIATSLTFVLFLFVAINYNDYHRPVGDHFRNIMGMWHHSP